MSPRPYQLGRRQAAAEETRARIVAAARQLLAAQGGLGGFTVDAVARAAGVARMTVYYQFGSRIGLLEALFDSLTSHRGADRLVAAMQRPDPLEGLAEFIQALSRFWSEDRPIVRRLQGLAAIDPDFEHVWQAREALRRQGLQALVERIAQAYGRPGPEGIGEAVDVLYGLVAFETFASIAGTARPLEQVAPVIYRLALAALGLGDR
ncbi:MAG TPA: TetR family transcriptional regulator [Actinomycetes bacterium]|nr:TetR family transcriptional regulator [Actinomycetes bacterium]